MLDEENYMFFVMFPLVLLWISIIASQENSDNLDEKLVEARQRIARKQDNEIKISIRKTKELTEELKVSFHEFQNEIKKLKEKTEKDEL